MTNDEEYEFELDLYDLGWHDGLSRKPADQDYCASEEYMAGYDQGSKEQ